MAQEVENKEVVEQEAEAAVGNPEEVKHSANIDETLNTAPPAEPEVKGFLDDEEEDEKDYNRILPRALANGKGIPVTLHKLPAVREIKKKDGGSFMAVTWEFYEAINDAYHKQNVPLPIEDVDVVSKQDEDIQKTNISNFKHLMGAFIDLKGIPALNWVDFAEKAIARIPATIVGSKAEIKLVYSKDNKYIQFPRFPNFISTAKKKKTLETDPNNAYDKVEKTKVASSGGMSTASDIDEAAYNSYV
jgi:hypothetical protein